VEVTNMSVALGLAEKLRVLSAGVGMSYLCVAFGAAIGGSARYAVSGIVANWMGATFPWGTLLINISGSFVIGIFNTLTAPDGILLVPTNFRILVMVGVCGGYTTFSSFSLESLNLMRNGEWLSAGSYILASVVCCLIGVWLGHVAAIELNR
jgi:fluoride exporter